VVRSIRWRTARNPGPLAGENAVTLSLGRTGQCWDNALAESFFASLKCELIDLQAWPTRAMARRAVVEHIGWYNGTRLHKTLGYSSPGRIRGAKQDQEGSPSKRGQPHNWQREEEEEGRARHR
jgi:transposase InsO family protein